MIRVYVAAVLIALIGAAWWRYDYIVKDRDRYKTNYEMATAAADQYREKVEATAKNVTEYQTKLDALLNENSNLRDAVNIGTKRVSVRATCPSTKATVTGTTEAAPELTATARQDYFRLRQGIITLEANYALCLKELN